MKKHTNNWEKSVYYLLVPILAIVVTFLGESTPFRTLLTELYFYTNLLWNIFAIALQFFFLNKSYAWLHKKRNFSPWITFLPIALIGDVLILIMSYLYIEIFWGQSIMDYPELFNYDLLNYIIWQIAYLFVLKLRDGTNQVQPSQEKEIRSVIPLKKRNETTLFPIESTYAIILKNGIVYLIDENGKAHSSDYKMKDFDDNLCSSVFFQANRQTIVSHKALKGYQSIGNRKTLILLIFDLETNLLVSKEKTPVFKKWWETHHAM